MNTMEVRSANQTDKELPYWESARSGIIQRVTDQYMYGRLQLEEMCNILRDIGEEEKARAYETTTNDLFRAGEDGFCISANRESEDAH